MSSSVGLVFDCCLCFLFGFVHVCVLQRLLGLLFSCSIYVNYHAYYLVLHYQANLMNSCAELYCFIL